MPTVVIQATTERPKRRRCPRCNKRFQIVGRRGRIPYFCPSCTLEWRRTKALARYHVDKERILARQRRWRAENHQRSLERERAYRQAHLVEMRRYHRLYKRKWRAQRRLKGLPT